MHEVASSNYSNFREEEVGLVPQNLLLLLLLLLLLGLLADMVQMCCLVENLPDS